MNLVLLDMFYTDQCLYAAAAEGEPAPATAAGVAAAAGLPGETLLFL